MQTTRQLNREELHLYKDIASEILIAQRENFFIFIYSYIKSVVAEPNMLRNIV